jgi:polyprenyl P-hydroxybenzoate/phenylacrylic acid decarboxylase-like protein
LVVAITGSSAPQLGLSLLGALRSTRDVETHLIISEQARQNLALEANTTAADVESHADLVYSPHDLAAAVASGSFQTIGMAIVPCSMKTLGTIAAGIGGDLIARCADVCLKERRRLVLVTRETPLSLIHIRNMETLTLAGATILPPVPAFYHQPKTVDELLCQISGKILDQFGIAHDLFQRWAGVPESPTDTTRSGPA